MAQVHCYLEEELICEVISELVLQMHSALIFLVIPINLSEFPLLPPHYVEIRSERDLYSSHENKLSADRKLKLSAFDRCKARFRAKIIDHLDVTSFRSAQGSFFVR